jgi:hypothetical protein
MAMTTTAAAIPAMRRMPPEEEFFFFLAWVVLSLSLEDAPEFVDVDAWARGPCLGPLGMSIVNAVPGRAIP